MFHARRQTPQAELDAKAETLLLIILYIYGIKLDIKEVRDQIRFSKRKSVDRSILARQIHTEAVSHILVTSYYVNIADIRYRTYSAQKGQVTIDSSVFWSIEIHEITLCNT